MIIIRKPESFSNQQDLKSIYEKYKETYPDLLDYSSDCDDVIVSDIRKRVLIELTNNLLANNPKESVPRNQLLYGGITNDIPSNLSRHKIKQYVVAVFVNSFETAKRIEERLYTDLQLCTGEGGSSSAGRGGKDEGGADDSRVVYIADMTIPGFEKNK